MSVEDFVKVERKVKDVLRKLGPEYEGEYLKKTLQTSPSNLVVRSALLEGAPVI